MMKTYKQDSLMKPLRLTSFKYSRIKSSEEIKLDNSASPALVGFKTNDYKLKNRVRFLNLIICN